MALLRLTNTLTFVSLKFFRYKNTFTMKKLSLLILLITICSMISQAQLKSELSARNIQLAWATIPNGGNTFDASPALVMNNKNLSTPTTVYAIQDYPYNVMTTRSMVPVYNSGAGFMQEDIDTDKGQASTNAANYKCHCNNPAWLCPSNDLYCQLVCAQKCPHL
jgi:hypothetical protein